MILTMISLHYIVLNTSSFVNLIIFLGLYLEFWYFGDLEIWEFYLVIFEFGIFWSYDLWNFGVWDIWIWDCWENGLQVCAVQGGIDTGGTEAQCGGGLCRLCYIYVGW